MALPNHERLLLKTTRAFCAEHAIELESFSYDWILRLRRAEHVRHIWGYSLELNSNTAHLIARDKSAAYALLAARDIPAVPHHIFLHPNESGYMSEDGSWSAMLRLFRTYGEDVVCKDNFGSGGAGVERARSVAALERAAHHTLTASRALALAPFVDIRAEYRCIILDEQPLLVYEKVRSPADRDDPNTFVTHNLSHGAEAVDVSRGDAVHDAIVTLARHTVRALNLRYASVDVIDDGEGALRVLEVNEGVSVEYYARTSDAHAARGARVYTAALRALMRLDTAPNA